MTGTLQVPQIVGSALANEAGASGLYALLKPFLEDTAKRVELSPRVHAGQSVPFVAPDDWVSPALQTGWVGTVGTGNAPFAWMKDATGRVWVRGRLDYPSGAPAAESLVAALPEGWAPTAREVVDAYGTDGTTRQQTLLSVRPATSGFTAGVYWVAGGSRNLSLSGQVSWDAANRNPTPWAKPLVVACPFVPTLLLIAAEVVPPGDPETRALLPQWRMGQRGPEVISCPGLRPLTRYRLTPWCLAL